MSFGQVGALPGVTIGREVITMNRARPSARAVAVVRQHIASVGSLAELQALARPQPYRIDRTVVADVIAIEYWTSLRVVCL